MNKHPVTTENPYEAPSEVVAGVRSSLTFAEWMIASFLALAAGLIAFVAICGGVGVLGLLIATFDETELWRMLIVIAVSVGAVAAFVVAVRVKNALRQKFLGNTWL